MGTRFNALGLGAALLCATLAAPAARAADALNVRFSWKLKGEYAPYYLGNAKGIYAAKGLDVKLGEGSGAPSVLGALLQGREDAVIIPGIFALSAIQKGMPVKIIALYHPKTPVVIISHPEKPVRTPIEMEGKKIVHSAGETGTSYLPTFCRINKVDCGKVQRITVDAQTRVGQFMQKQVDMVSIYRTNDLPVAQAKVTVPYVELDLAEYGLAIPGMAVVASDAGIAAKPELLKRFLAATNEAIAATRREPAAAVDAVRKVWATAPSEDLVGKQVQATIDAVIAVPGHPVGWVDAKAIDQAVELLRDEEDIGKAKPASAFFTNDLLPAGSARG